MHKVEYAMIHESMVEHQLCNGLKIVIIEKPDYLSSSFFLAIPYGSCDLNQEDFQQHYKDASGIAHFLEHKLFENNNGTDIMEAFSALGAHVNAFTSHTETVYTFSLASKRLKKPLNLLLDFVQALDITESSVEKEKGIIVQELNMYLQMPEQRLILETYQSLYQNHPIRLDIGGTDVSVHSITKEALERVYARNYQPHNCVLVCVSPIKASKIIEMVEANQSRKTFAKLPLPKRSLIQEPTNVLRDTYEFEMDIQASKLTYSFKLIELSTDPLENLRQEWSLRLYLELLFSSIQPAYQDWIQSQRIHDYFGYEVEVNQEYGFVMFYGETENSQDFINLIHEGLNTGIEPLLTHLVSLKRRYHALLVRSLDDHDDYAHSLIRSIFQKIPFEQQFKLIESIEVKDVLQSARHFKDSPTAMVWMKKKI